MDWPGVTPPGVWAAMGISHAPIFPHQTGSTMRSITANGRALLAGFAIALSGCVLLPTSGGIDRSVEAPIDPVFQATVHVLRARGFTLKEIDRAQARIVTDRRPVRAVGTDADRWPRPVEKAKVTLEPDDGQTDVHLFLRFVDQVSGPPRRVPDDGDNERADDVTRAVLNRSYDADATYKDYLDAIADRVQDTRDTDGS